LPLLSSYYKGDNENYSTIASVETSAAGTSDFLLFFPVCHNKHQLKVNYAEYFANNLMVLHKLSFHNKKFKK